MNGPASKPKTLSAVGAPEWLSAAECAARTGLTVKALRLYERHGLINPPRSPNGWRRYGAIELARLNSVVILKGLGLTLSQIRAVFTDKPPSLLRILMAHAQSWKAKRDMAERALSLVQAAVDRMLSQQSLSLDELCELIRRLEINRSVDMKSPNVLTRELINESVTPDEERAWNAWWTEHPEDMAAAQAYMREQDVLTQEAWQLMDAGATPTSAETQDVIRRHLELLGRYGVRERNQRQLQWNSQATHKWFGIGVKMGQLRDEQHSERRRQFWAAAVRASPSALAFREVMVTVCQIMKTQDDPAASELDGPIARIRAICAEYELGDALAVIQWRLFLGHFYGYLTPPEELFEAEWKFVERAVLARS